MDIIQQFNEEAKLLHIQFEQEDGFPTLCHYRSEKSSPLIISNSELRFTNSQLLPAEAGRLMSRLGR